MGELSVVNFGWQIINFLLLLFILNKLLYKPMLQMLSDRKQTIADSLEQSAAARAEADKLKAEYEAHLANAKMEAQEIINKATKIGEEMKEDLITQAKVEAEKAIEKAHEEIGREKTAAIASLRSEVANLAVLAAGKVVGKSITVADHEQMVKEFVEEVGDLPC